MSVNLAKETFINLKKTANEIIEQKGLGDVTAQVKLVLDASGSMSDRYLNGTVQKVVERLLAIGSKFDDNKKIEVYLFDSESYYVGEVGEDDFENYVNRKILSTYDISGGTNYSPVMNMVANKVLGIQPKQGLFKSLFGKKEHAQDTSKNPTYVLFVTDGENFDREQSRETIIRLSNKPIFWQFVGIGNESFSFLKGLDNMTGRFIDNANFFQVNDIDRIDDKELYNRMLNEFPSWIDEAKQKGLIK